MSSINKLKLEDFAKTAIHTRCRAFAFKSAYMWFEYHSKFSSNEKHPKFELEGDNIQGTFHFIDDNSISDLWLVLTDFQKKDIEFYTFWRKSVDKVKEESITHTEWIIWTPCIEFAA